MAYADGAVELYPAEQELMSRAVPSRVAEFATTRDCARRALARLGHPPGPIPQGPILRGPGGEPLWPDGVVGSLTHCTGYRAAAVAPADMLKTLGIDAEPHGPLPPGVESLVTVPADTLPSSPGLYVDRVLFCAKEAIYKAWYPRQRRWLGFDQVAVHVRTDGTFSARLLADDPDLDPDPVAGLTGRWAVDGDVALAVAYALS